MKKEFLIVITLFILNKSTAQDSSHVAPDSISISTIQADIPDDNAVRYAYKTSFKKDAPIIAAGLGLTYLGNNIIKNKKPLTVADLANKTRDKVPFFDRGNAGYYDEDLDKASYIPFLASFGMPLIMLANKNEARNASHILVMYIESLSITSTLFTLTAGTINRPRPLVYSTKASTDERLNKNNQRSFYAGHTAATASATFFAAKVFQDLNPDSKAKTLVWIVAASLPVTVGYLRYQAGMHFLSDNILGYALGAASGILIPEWHKSKRHNNVTFFPLLGKDFKGVSFVYNIK